MKIVNILNTANDEQKFEWDRWEVSEFSVHHDMRGSLCVDNIINPPIKRAVYAPGTWFYIEYEEYDAEEKETKN
ncbi:hypothetical protein AC477_00100 [miscellaneous Crenarchaeota group-1 archaeon SG8-32-1]|uniref:Uncharacterized protein n=1 Tax=miscellaneous Crenarchaeota group-1 archaeon SG8-32-1 TaxID=1685124 RepID=A0A0M0C2S1_9ARCH|nr:MAG: hypothetical protein AC477_00100 [miscellaneous Crenarchaeota group-1 archaeon SG8-32-1]